MDFTSPAREAALGGNGVAVPAGTSSLVFNPAGLANEYRYQVSARYENLFAGLEGDDLSTVNLSAVVPLGLGDSFGLSVDQFGAANLQQYRLSAAFGKDLGVGSLLKHLRLGLSLSYLAQQYTLLAPLVGVDSSKVSAGGFSIGAGALYDPFPWMTLGLSGQDLNEPNLGVVGVDRQPFLLRWGIAVRPPVNGDRLTLTLSQSWSDGDAAVLQGGGEWTFPLWGVAVRAGADPNMAVVGFGWTGNDLSIDYAYQFSWNQAPSLGGLGLPGSQFVEVSFSWENSSREKKIMDDLLLEGKKALDSHQWKEANHYYQQAALLHPNDPQVLKGLSASLERYNQQRAAAYFRDGQKAEDNGFLLNAQRNYEWAVYLCPDESSYAQARDRVKRSRAEGALGDPRARGLMEEAMGLAKKGDHPGAARKFKAAQTLYPKDAFLDFMAKAFSKTSYSNLNFKDQKIQQMAVEAEIYRSKGRLDLARETWKDMLKQDPGNQIAGENMAESSGAGSSTQLTKSEKAHIKSLLQRGLKAYANGEVQTAVQDWQAVLKMDPLNVDALNDLTRVKMEEGGQK